jgi:hypothetical protein
MKTVIIEFDGCITMEVDAATDEQAGEIALSKILAQRSRFDPPTHDMAGIGVVEIHDAEVVSID